MDEEQNVVEEQVVEVDNTTEEDERVPIEPRYPYGTMQANMEVAGIESIPGAKTEPILVGFSEEY